MGGRSVDMKSSPETPMGVVMREFMKHKQAVTELKEKLTNPPHKDLESVSFLLAMIELIETQKDQILLEEKALDKEGCKNIIAAFRGQDKPILTPENKIQGVTGLSGVIKLYAWSVDMLMSNYRKKESHYADNNELLIAETLQKIFLSFNNGTEGGRAVDQFYREKISTILPFGSKPIIERFFSGASTDVMHLKKSRPSNTVAETPAGPSVLFKRATLMIGPKISKSKEQLEKQNQISESFKNALLSSTSKLIEKIDEEIQLIEELKKCCEDPSQFAKLYSDKKERVTQILKHFNLSDDDIANLNSTSESYPSNTLSQIVKKGSGAVSNIDAILGPHVTTSRVATTMTGILGGVVGIFLVAPAIGLAGATATVVGAAGLAVGASLGHLGSIQASKTTGSVTKKLDHFQKLISLKDNMQTYSANLGTCKENLNHLQTLLNVDTLNLKELKDTLNNIQHNKFNHILAFFYKDTWGKFLSAAKNLTNELEKENAQGSNTKTITDKLQLLNESLEKSKTQKSIFASLSLFKTASSTIKEKQKESHQSQQAPRRRTQN